jgi:hypothetical protein
MAVVVGGDDDKGIDGWSMKSCLYGKKRTYLCFCDRPFFPFEQTQSDSNVNDQRDRPKGKWTG